MEDIEKTFLKMRKNGIWLSDDEVDILKRYGISCEECHQMTEILYQIDRILEDEMIEELDILSLRLAERNYYQNTRK